ncbi:MAG: 1-deoxy-D-xylulose-5-phosphate synthase, partial [Clostridia bacterium]|nr:1-deoxy-D-xylulose-5-phosphate synthase [Clostridia bacterium]
MSDSRYPLLFSISSPTDLRAMPEEAMPALCEEIRAYLLETIPKTGGHLASNLGVVELTVALHRVFDTPTDRIIFDVGHQSYVHKLLTGRREAFDTLRTPGGLSGFTRRAESEYDAFGAGHSSTSLSAALGFAKADRLAGRKSYTVAVVGDGAYTGGMIHEALNNCEPDLPLIIVLNENEMSISRNIGGFARYIAGIRNSGNYRRAKTLTTRILPRIPLLGKPLYRLLRGIKQLIKNRLFSSNYFEELGLYYLGPADGNSYTETAFLLRQAKKQNESVILHLSTKKGKGYLPAEEHPAEYHSVYTSQKTGEHMPAAAGRMLGTLAAEDESVAAITAAMREGTGLCPFFEAYPERAFDVGIAEAHAVTFAAGLAAAGMKPYVALYSTFLQRAYDSIVHDVALQRLPVRLLVDRAGLAPGDGPTHHGIFDVAFLSHIPEMTIFAPATVGSLSAILRDSLSASAPLAIRYENRADDPAITETFYPNGDYGAHGVRPSFKAPDEARDGVILTYGAITAEALRARAILAAQGMAVGVILLERLKPYDSLAALLAPHLAGAPRILFLEEGIAAGGAGMLLGDALQRAGVSTPYRVLAIEDHFASPPHPVSLRTYCGISAEDAAK